MAEYLVLIYGDEAAFENPTQEDFNQMMEGHAKFGEKHDGALRGGNALQPSSTATSIRGDVAGKFTITDGPFAETKEVLGGYYVIEASDLDQAISIAKDIPAPAGGLEVRPIRTFD